MKLLTSSVQLILLHSLRDITVQSLFQEDGALGFLGLGDMFGSGSGGGGSGGGYAGFGNASVEQINAEYLKNPNVTQEEIAAKYP